MPFILRAISIAVLMSAASGPAAGPSAPVLPSEIRLLVRPKPATLIETPFPAGAAAKGSAYSRPANLRFQSPALDSLGRRFACKPIARLCPWDAKEGTLVLRFPRGAASAAALIAAYRATGKFDLVESDGIGHGHGAAGRAALSMGASAGDPDDPFFAAQYALRNPGGRVFGSLQSKAGADIEAVEAWKTTPGSDSILVAVLDGGLKVDHPDIAAAVHVNKGEIPGNGKDDDGNGFIDDINGWRFANDDEIESRAGTADVGDSLGHGTNVAGILGAIAGNGIGLAGVARCRIMPVKVLNAYNWGYYSWWAAGIRYAVDNGARIVNMSMGGPGGNVAVLRSAVDYALQHNVILVVSMGNARSQVPEYPAAYDEVIAVGATGPDDRYVSAFPWDSTKGSNFGSHISVCAPGNFIYGLHYADKADYATYWSGTSQAAPHVAGVCALLLAQDPRRKPAEVKRLLEAGADDQVGDPAQDTPGFDMRYGHGRLNARRSLAAGMATAIRPLHPASFPGAVLFGAWPRYNLYDLKGRSIPAPGKP